MSLFLVGATGNHQDFLQHTAPLVEKYATKHGHSFLEGQLQPQGRPASWGKIPLLLDLLSEWDEIIWIDADVVIIDGSKDITKGMFLDHWQGVVIHDTPEGFIPNMGVWIVRPQLEPYLKVAWDQVDLIQHCWWEQAAMMRLMGHQLNPVKQIEPENVLWKKTVPLNSRWNNHPFYPVPKPFFEHITVQTVSHEQRLQRIRETANKSNL